MTCYEHEILTFRTDTKKGMRLMADKLAEWGAAGYEVVSVVSTSMSCDAVNVFLKRKVFIERGFNSPVQLYRRYDA